MIWNLIVNNISPILGLFGTLLIFLFGVPAVVEGDEYTHFVVGNENEQVKNKIKWYKRLSRFGLACLFFSFLFQFKI